MSKTTRILVIGATGQVGGAALDFLADKPGIDVFGTTRDLSKKSSIEAKGAVARELDLDDPASIQSAVEGIESLLLVTGYSVSMLHQSLRVIDAAKIAGVKHIVHIGASSSPTSDVAHWGWHRMIEAYIEQQGFIFTHLHPESFMQNLTGFGWLQESTISNLLGDARWSWVDARDVGAMAGAALLGDERLRNKSVSLGYDSASIQEIATKLREDFDVSVEMVDVAPDSFYEGAVSAGADPVYMACVREQLELNAQGRIPDADKTFDSGFFEKVVKRAPRKLRNFLSEYASNLAGV